jgi:hypothetical protein
VDTLTPVVVFIHQSKLYGFRIGEAVTLKILPRPFAMEEVHVIAVVAVT